jgi:hypothetical protein
MVRKVIRGARRALCAALALALLGGPGIALADPGCDSCPWPICCGHYSFCLEGGPRIKFHRTCPKPVCPPCDLEHWGYYETCWRAWPFPPDWTHCPVPPPSAHMEGQVLPTLRPAAPLAVAPGSGSRIRTDQGIPMPRPSNGL